MNIIKRFVAIQTTIESGNFAEGRGFMCPLDGIWASNPLLDVSFYFGFNELSIFYLMIYIREMILLENSVFLKDLK